MTRNFITATYILWATVLVTWAGMNNGTAQAAVYYWDTNGATAGAGGATPTGTWSTSVANWSTDPTGSSSTSNWTNSASRAYFSAGSDAIGTYTVNVGTVTTTQETGLKNVTVGSGNITFNGGTLTINSIAYGGGFEVAAGASATIGTTTISRTGTNSGFSYLSGAGTLSTPGFAAFPGGGHFVVSSGGAWDFGTVASIGTSRVMVVQSTVGTPNVFQGNGNFARVNGNGSGQFYWLNSGGFAARGGALNVQIPTTVTFGATNQPSDGGALVLGSPSADSLVDYKSNLSLGTGAQFIDAWNPNNNAGNVARISGTIGSGAGGSFTKVGLGTLELTAANTYNGGTTVEAGTLLLNNLSGSASGSGSITVQTGGILGGTGTANLLTGNMVTINAGGTLAPGASVGTLTINGDVVIDGTLENEVSGSSTDLLAISGDLTLGSGSVLDLVGSFDGVTDYTIATFTGNLTGTFGTINGLNDYEILYGANSISLSLAPVPEPSSIMMLGLGLLGLVGRSRSRRRKA